MPKFNIGDRVRCIESYQGGIFPGDCGVIMKFDYSGRAGVNMDNYREGCHKLGGMAARGHGWWVPERCLEYEEVQDFGDLPRLDIMSIL